MEFPVDFDDTITVPFGVQQKKSDATINWFKKNIDFKPTQSAVLVTIEDDSKGQSKSNPYWWGSSWDTDDKTGVR